MQYKIENYLHIYDLFNTEYIEKKMVDRSLNISELTLSTLQRHCEVTLFEL